MPLKNKHDVTSHLLYMAEGYTKNFYTQTCTEDGWTADDEEKWWMSSVQRAAAPSPSRCISAHLWQRHDSQMSPLSSSPTLLSCPALGFWSPACQHHLSTLRLNWKETVSFTLELWWGLINVSNPTLDTQCLKQILTEFRINMSTESVSVVMQLTCYLAENNHSFLRARFTVLHVGQGKPEIPRSSEPISKTYQTQTPTLRPLKGCDIILCHDGIVLLHCPMWQPLGPVRIWNVASMTKCLNFKLAYTYITHRWLVSTV